MYEVTNQIDYFTEMNFYAAFLEVGILSRIMDQLGKFALPHFAGAVTEHKKERVNSVRLSRSVRADYTGERLY